MNSRILLTSTTCLVLALSAPSALARCAQRDLAGEWQFYNSFAEASLGGGWSRCLLAIDRDGTVSGLESCVDFDGGSSNIVTGQLAVAADCVVTGSVTVLDGAVQSTAVIEHATIDTRGATVHGVGRDSGSLPGFSFTMVKK